MPQKKSATAKSGSKKKLSVSKRPIKDLKPSEKDAKKVKGGVFPPDFSRGTKFSGI